MITSLVEELKRLLETDDINVVFSSDGAGITIVVRIKQDEFKLVYLFDELSWMSDYDDLFHTVINDIKNKLETKPNVC